MPHAIVTAFKSDRANYSHLTLARPEGFTYVPGQYVTLAQDATEKPKFLAIASHASESNLFFLSRNSPPTVGAEMILSEPMGKGFTCDFKNPQAFLFLTHGTGISAIRPALIERRQSGFTHDTLLYGIRDAASEPELDCLAESFGVRQLRALSAEKHWHVQDALAALDLSGFSAVVLVGSKEMAASCQQVLAAKNFPAENIFSNY